MRNLIRLRHFLTTTFILALSTSLWAQSSAFTYQGRLNANGNLANGTYDFRFRLAADAAGNSFLGSPWTTNGVLVTGGFFTVGVDFGAANFTGADRWIQVDVRTNGAGGYTTLNPLQPLRPTPYAVFAGSASNVLGSVPAAQVNGVLTSGNLPGSPTFPGAVVANSFVGNGSGVTNVSAAQLGGLSSANFWQTGGNAGTTAGANYLGTTDNQALVFKVNGQQAMRYEPTTNAPNIIGGSISNRVPSGITGATIAGGGATNAANSVTNAYGAIGGGSRNLVGQQHGVVGGGYGNMNLSMAGVIAGGWGNYLTNGSTGTGLGVIGGGADNYVTGDYGTVPGGYYNQASGLGSFAAGFGAHSLHDNSFVWSDGSVPIFGSFDSTAGKQFLVLATGGVGINTNSPKATLDVNGSIRIGSVGTIITNFQAGQTIMLGSTSAATNIVIAFPRAFSSAPKILVSVANDPAWPNVSDTFVASVSSNSATAFRVNIVRVDQAVSWSQQLRINWQAWQ